MFAGFVGMALLLVVAVAAIASGPEGSPVSATALQEIPPDLLEVYIAAAETCPGLPWQVLAAIGFVESRHAEGRADPATGDVAPPILGPALDGTGGNARIPDPSFPDGWSHAEGPMQFLPSTWARWARLAPGRPPGATPSPENAWDSIYTAAAYLCAGHDRLTDVDAAILSYNHSDAYLKEVLAKAAQYGLGAGEAGRGGGRLGAPGPTCPHRPRSERADPPSPRLPGVGLACAGRYPDLRHPRRDGGQRHDLRSQLLRRRRLRGLRDRGHDQRCRGRSSGRSATEARSRSAPGQSVVAGQQVLASGNTGSSTGPHVHVQIRAGGVLRCPQSLMVSLYENGTGTRSDDPADIGVHVLSHDRLRLGATQACSLRSRRIGSQVSASSPTVASIELSAARHSVAVAGEQYIARAVMASRRPVTDTRASPGSSSSHAFAAARSSK